MQAVVFGAGNIGKGLVGVVLAEAGYQITFVDANEQLVDALASAGSFWVMAGPRSTEVPIAQALSAKDEQRVTAVVASADVIATAVGPPILKIVARSIAAGLARRTTEHVNVLACENVHPNSEALRAHVTEILGEQLDGVGFPNVVVDRIVPGDPAALEVVVEEDFEFVIDRKQWVGPLPAPNGMIFTEDLHAYKLRKLWLVNGLHAITAWLGLERGIETIDAAIEDRSITEIVRSAASTMVAALATQTNEFSHRALSAYAEKSLERFANKGLVDPTNRVARNPLLKLAPDERVVGPARIAEQAGLDLAGLAEGVAAVLRLDDQSVPGVEELQTVLKELGPERFLQERSGLDPDGPFAVEVLRRLKIGKTESGERMITHEIVIENPAGLHARPASQIVERAKNLRATIQIRKGERIAKANSIMSVLALGANTGDAVTVVAEGDEAEAAMMMITEVLTSKEH